MEAGGNVLERCLTLLRLCAQAWAERSAALAGDASAESSDAWEAHALQSPHLERFAARFNMWGLDEDLAFRDQLRCVRVSERAWAGEVAFNTPWRGQTHRDPHRLERLHLEYHQVCVLLARACRCARLAARTDSPRRACFRRHVACRRER